MFINSCQCLNEPGFQLPFFLFKGSLQLLKLLLVFRFYSLCFLPSLAFPIPVAVFSGFLLGLFLDLRSLLLRLCDHLIRL